MFKVIVLSVLLGASLPVLAQDMQRFDIPSQDLATSLNKFGVEADWQIVFAPEVVRDLKAPKLEGSFTREQAIRKLLEGSGLEYRFMGPGTVAVSKQGEKGRTSAQSVDIEVLRVARAEGQSSSEQKTDRPAIAQDDREDKVQEIVVTAQRREERLRDVPIAISVLSGDALDRSTDRGIAEALNRVPGVSTQITTTAARLGSSSGTVVMRGVPPAAGVSPTAYYLDSIPFGFAKQTFAPDSNGYDLERVEVLRGPQGTLYGLSALNGVVRVLTKDANLDKFEAKARMSGSMTEKGGESYRADAALNVPLIDGKLAVRAVVGYQDISGWIDKPTGKDANDAKIGTYRLKINARPTDRLSVGMFGWLSRTEVGAPSFAGLRSAADRFAGPEPFVNLSSLDESSTTDYDAYGLKVGYDFPGVSLTGMTSYIDYRIHARFDFAPFTIANVLNLSKTESRIFAQEINLNSSREGPWRWSLGAIYRDSKDVQLLSRRDPITGAFALPYVAPNISGTESESFALFGELTRAFFDGRLELTGGLRYFEDKVRDTEISRQQCINGIPAGLGSCPLQANQALVPAPQSILNNTFDNLSPRVVLTWHRAATQTIYASYSQGYRSGQNQAFATDLLVPGFPPAEPDKLKNYELGAKVGLWDGRVNLDAALFFIDWQDVPQLLGITIPGPSPFLVTPIVNAKSSSGLGVESGVSIRMSDGLTLGVNFSWNDLKVDGNVLTNNLVLFPEGSRLNNSPEYTVGAMADYRFALGVGGVESTISAAANYLPETTVVRSQTGATYAADSITMARASFALQFPNGFATTLYADNLANEKGLVRDAISSRWNTYVRPRTIGLQFDYRY